MARKGRDLFELLQLRARGGVPEPRASVSSGADLLGDLRAQVSDWFSSSFRPRSKRSRGGRGRKRASRSRSSSAGFGSALLAGLAFACLAVGFLLGRLTAGGDPRNELRMPAATPPTVFPQSPTSGPGGLRPDQEVATLSSFFFILEVYPQPQRAKASQLAAWLRQNGVEEARIRSHSTKTGKDVWIVLVYVIEEATEEALSGAETVLEQLRALPAPPFEPEFPQVVQKLSVAKLMKL
ncbi:MAG: hypothetical protein AAF628_28660 [Planctomycetota bacterium]